MDIRVKIGIIDDHCEQFIGPGLVQLLDFIREYKSIKRAAKEMGLSYKKAHKMLNRLENDLKEKVLIRKRGGRERGGTDISPLGEIYMDEFVKLEERVKTRAVEEYAVFEQRIEKRKRETQSH